MCERSLFRRGDAQLQLAGKVRFGGKARFYQPRSGIVMQNCKSRKKVLLLFWMLLPLCLVIPNNFNKFHYFQLILNYFHQFMKLKKYTISNNFFIVVEIFYRQQRNVCEPQVDSTAVSK